ncbi:MAG TPA: alpha/beta fold hydrolase [Rhodospirillaceae bacterium]|nr:alpha/beta fold hydrolase [Rhodospirillaceae bacterium]
MTPILLLVHGWGFDASFWNPLRAALGSVETVSWDLGFVAAPSRPALPEGRPVVAVGHSYGLLWLLHERPLAWQALVSINGFPRFSRAPDFPDGWAPRVLDRMIGRLDDQPGQVHHQFITQCGGKPPPVTRLDANRLKAGVQALLDWDERPAIPDLVLAGRSDPIARTALTQASFPETSIRWHEGGHLLPLEAPDWCAQQLQTLLEERS